MTRTITTHAINPCNEKIGIHVLDEPGPGGACHAYEMRIVERKLVDDYTTETFNAWLLEFQNGPVKENGEGTNGITHEALIAIILDRMNAFQAGPYKCRENALAITKLEEAMHWLNARTKAREARGVEGTAVV